MSTIEAFIRRHPLLTYYTLTFSISWGGMLVVIGGPGGLPGSPEQADRLMGIAFSLMAGPSVSGLLLTGLVSGRAGLRDLLTRLLRWRVGARWYAVALLTGPLLVTAPLLALLPTSSDFLPGILATRLARGAVVRLGRDAARSRAMGWPGLSAALIRLAAEGGTTQPVEDAAEALARIATKHTRGKLVLAIS